MTLRERTFDPLATAFGHREREPSAGAREDVRAMLQSGAGDPSHLRALFGDVELHTLCRLAAEFAIDDSTLASAYARARRVVAAANAELDEFAAQFDLDLGGPNHNGASC